MIEPLEKLKWLAVDLDHTLANTSDYPDFKLLEPIEENVEKLRACAALGYKAIIHTSRHWIDYALIEDWLETNNIPYKAIVCGKLLAHRYIDDRAIPADAEDWTEHL